MPRVLSLDPTSLLVFGP